MNRKISGTMIGALIVVAAACGGAEPGAEPPTPANVDVKLPEDRQVIDVPVTRPPAPEAVDVDDLPATARAVSQMPGLSADDRLCANYAIKTTIDQDPSIVTTNAKMASVLGNSVVACTPPATLATIVTGGIGGNGTPLSDEQRACLERTVAGDTAGTGKFLSALLTLDLGTVMAASKRYDEACQVKVAPA